jgi:exonuclease SbcC
VREHEDAIKKSDESSSREVQGIKSELDQINKQIDQLGLERGEKQTAAAKCETEIESLKRGQEEFKSLKRQWRIYETLISAYSKKGLPSQILDKLLPAINLELAEILNGVVTFQVQLEIDQETNSLEIYIDYGDSRRIIELGSGMEKMVASLAIRVALTRITSLPKPDFIVIDEGFGTLDETQLVSCISLIKSLKRIYRFILVISHVDAVKDAVDQVIEITREAGTSRVVA